MMIRAAFLSVLADITLSPLAASQLREEAAIDVRYGLPCDVELQLAGGLGTKARGIPVITIRL